MSFNDVYEFIQGEYQQVTRIRQEPVSTADPTFFKDLNLVKWAGYSNEIWSAETGGTQLVQGLDYELQYLDVAASGPAGEPVYSGYSILTPLYYNIPLFQTANIVGAYTTRPYRPSYNVITTDTTVTPVSMDDSVIADASAGNIIIKLEDGFHLNQRYSIICKGTGTVTVGGTGIGAGAAFQGVGVSWLWDGGEWMPLAAPGAREGGFYYDYVPAFIRPDVDPISATIPDFLATYGEGFFYVGLEFTYQGTTDKTNGTFAIADDDIDKYAVLAVDVAGGDSTLSIQWQWATDTMVAIETGTDFTDLNLWAVYRWEKVTYGGYGAWANTAEAPTYGEPIVSGQELYLDGTKEFVSSDGNAPVVDVVDYLPAVINVDGSEAPEANSKWPGQRGTYGFFGQYENILAGIDPALAVSTISEEGGWTKLTATAPNAYMSFVFSALSSSGFIEVLVRNGDSSTDPLAYTASGQVSAIFETKSFSFSNGAINAGSVFISDEIAIIRFKPSGPGVTNLRLYAGTSSSVAGDFYYFKDWMVADLPYAVPYVAGVHQPAKLQYSFNWAESSDWTIQGWFKTAGIPGDGFKRIVQVGFGENASYFNQIFYFDINNSTGLLRLVTYSDNVITTQEYSAIAQNTEYNLKINYVSGASITPILDGVSLTPVSTNVPIAGSINKIFQLCCDSTYDAQLNGYAQDWTIQPGIDTSDAHYLSGLPWYSSDKTYGKNASWSIDSRGNISGNNQLSGSIIQDEEINGQRIVRWDTGRMVVNGEDTGGGANPVGVLFNPPFSAGNYSMNITCNAATPVMAVYSGKDVGSVNVHRFTDAGAATTSSFTWTATGRWK